MCVPRTLRYSRAGKPGQGGGPSRCDMGAAARGAGEEDSWQVPTHGSALRQLGFREQASGNGRSQSSPSATSYGRGPWREDRHCRSSTYCCLLGRTNRIAQQCHCFHPGAPNCRHLIWMRPSEVGSVTPILQVGKVRSLRVDNLSQSHTGSELNRSV